MTCPICQHDNREEARFCEACGARLTGEARDRSAELRQRMPRSLTDKILAAGGQMAGERKSVTVVFADISGFTAMSEQMDAEEVRNLVNRCFEALVEVIHRYEGVVDKFIGDEVMALFGAPVAHENDPERAVRASIEMLEVLEGIAAELPHRVGMHVGINTGEVVAGGVGTDLRMDYTVMGDTVNLTKRLESAARSGQILVSQSVFRATERIVEYHRLRPIRVKGKSERIPVYEALGMKAHPARVRGVTPGYAPLVGRAREVAQVQQVADALAQGEGGILCITGDAGIGKSRLKYELMGMLSDLGIRSVEGACASYEVPSPYQVVGQVCRELLGIEEEEPPERVREKLAGAVGPALAPYLGSVIGVRYDEVLLVEDAVRQGRACEAVVALIRARTADGSIAVVFEDFHWRDDLSQAVMDHLVDRAETMPVLICCLFRPEFRHAWSGRPLYREVTLSPLTAEDSLELAESLLALRLPDTVREVILQKAEGNPFYIEEVLKMFIDEGVIARTRRGYEIQGDVSRVRVPETIQGLIMSRIDRLEEQAKQTLQRASVIGRNFPRRLLEAVSEDREAVDGHLARLQEMELVYRYEIMPELEYIFKHLLTQEVAYSGLLLQRRKEIHLQIGQAIEELYQDRLEEYYEVLAYHYSNGEAWEKAFQYYNRAGNRTRELHSDAGSLQFYERGREALGRLFQSREEVSRFQRVVRWGVIPLSLLIIGFSPSVFVPLMLLEVWKTPVTSTIFGSSMVGLLVCIFLFGYRFILASRTAQYLSVYPDRFQIITKKGVEEILFSKIKSISTVGGMRFLSRGMFTRARIVGGGLLVRFLLRRQWWVLVERRDEAPLLVYSRNAETFVQEIQRAALRWIRGQEHMPISFDTRTVRHEEREAVYDIKEMATGIFHKRIGYSDIVGRVIQRKIQPVDLISREEGAQGGEKGTWETVEQFSTRHPLLRWSFRPVLHGLKRGTSLGIGISLLLCFLSSLCFLCFVPLLLGMKIWKVSIANSKYIGITILVPILSVFIVLLAGVVGLGTGVLIKIYSMVRVGLTNRRQLTLYEKYALLSLLAIYPIGVYAFYVGDISELDVRDRVTAQGLILAIAWVIGMGIASLTQIVRMTLYRDIVLLSRKEKAFLSVGCTIVITIVAFSFHSMIKIPYYLFKGNVYKHFRQEDKALQAYEQGISLNPGDASGHENKAVLLGRLNRYDEAVTEYNRALEIDSKRVSAHYRLGVMYDKKKLKDKAIAEWKRVIDLYQPDKNFFIFSLASNSYWRGQACNAIARNYAEEGVRLDEALSLINRGRLLDWHQTDFLDTKAWILYKMGNYHEARKYMDMALKREPKNRAFLEHSEAITKALQER